MHYKEWREKMNTREITLASNCYEKNYKLITSEEWSNRLFMKDCDLIDHRTLMISNVKDRTQVESYIHNLLSRGLVNDYYYSYDYIDCIEKKYMGCKRKSFYRRPTVREYVKGILHSKKMKFNYDGMLYSASQIASIITCKSKWLLYLTEDVYLDVADVDIWINKAINLMEEDKRVIVANPLWNNDIEGAERESCYSSDEFWFSYGFSDQCCLINAQWFQDNRDVFSEKNRTTEKVFPYYAGNHFERRISAYMRNHGLLRATYKHGTYIHKDITEEQINSASNLS